MTSTPSTGLPEMMVQVHQTLAAAGLPHAFGGALALAWCTQQARGTIDIDLNVFAPPEDHGVVVAALPSQVSCTDADRDLLVRDGQARLWWEATPIDVFLNTTDFHAEVAARVRWEPFAGQDLPFLGCTDLAVFKAFFDRTQDWADLEAMQAAGTLDVDTTAAALARHLGDDDHRLERLRRLALGH